MKNPFQKTQPVVPMNLNHDARTFFNVFGVSEARWDELYEAVHNQWHIHIKDGVLKKSIYIEDCCKLAKNFNEQMLIILVCTTIMVKEEMKHEHLGAVVEVDGLPRFTGGQSVDELLRQGGKVKN